LLYLTLSSTSNHRTDGRSRRRTLLSCGPGWSAPTQRAATRFGAAGERVKRRCGVPGQRSVRACGIRQRSDETSRSRRACRSGMGFSFGLAPVGLCGRVRLEFLSGQVRQDDQATVMQHVVAGPWRGSCLNAPGIPDFVDLSEANQPDPGIVIFACNAGRRLRAVPRREHQNTDRQGIARLRAVLERQWTCRYCRRYVKLLVFGSTPEPRSVTAMKSRSCASSDHTSSRSTYGPESDPE
jgi:hypothetical protein